MSDDTDKFIKAFGMSALLIEDDINKISENYGFQLKTNSTEISKKILEYEQFPMGIRKKSLEMSRYYELFFCLEVSIRDLVSQTLIDAEGSNWWQSKRVTEGIQNEVILRQKKEVDSGFEVRSEFEIDYTTFGELSQLITNNWDIFQTIFKSKSAVSSILTRLNVLRGPIAHCSQMSDDEKTRLEITVRDWFRTLS